MVDSYKLKNFSDVSLPGISVESNRSYYNSVISMNLIEIARCRGGFEY